MIQKSIAQRALDATYPASRLSEAVSAAYWLAACHEDQATVMAIGRMQEAEERLASIAEAMGFTIERIVSEPAVTAWQPIATAPRDRSLVWLWNKHCADKSEAPQRFWWSTHYSVFGLGGCWTDGLCTMGDKIDFDFWCHDLPANFLDPYANIVVSESDAAEQADDGWNGAAEYAYIDALRDGSVPAAADQAEVA